MSLERANRLRAVLVENEEHSLSRLRRLLQGFPHDIEVVGEASDGPSAVDTIRAQAPEIVFLDIDLPGFNGFQVLSRLDRQPMVIFTTAYNQHALDAFKTHAIAYLLKPIEAEAIGGALAKLRAMGFDHGHLARAMEQLLRPPASPYLSRLQCRNRDSTVVLKIGEILYLQSDNKYTSVHASNRDYLIDTPLVELERRLDPAEFIRIHRSTLVNVSWIDEIQRPPFESKTTVVLRDAKRTKLPVSRMYADNLRKI